MYVNRVFLIGRVGRDAEISHVGNTQVAKFSMVTSERWKDSNGDQKEKSDWHRVAIWGKQGELAGTLIKKGAHLMVEGSMHYNTWNNAKGEQVTTAEVRCSKFWVIAPPKNQVDTPELTMESVNNNDDSSIDDMIV